MKIIVAHDDRLGIGKGNNLPWNLTADLKFFRKLTTEVTDPLLVNAVIMGRHTWESIPLDNRPLPGRYNLVLSRNSQTRLSSQAMLCGDFQQALSILSGLSIETCFLIGGAAIFKDAIENQMCSTIYATEIRGDFTCDRFFPEYRQEFALIEQSKWHRENNCMFRFNHYVRKQSS